MLIEINLSQIRTLDIKREKVCAVCPYLLFIFDFVMYFLHACFFEFIFMILFTEVKGKFVLN